MRTVAPPEIYPAGGSRPAYALIDVRAPIEFARGALPGSVNLPILTDDERHQVGLRYKEAGQPEAIALGEQLTRTAMPERIARWRAVCDAGPTAVTCWRGGLRSKLAVRYLDRPDVPRVAGGYKAVRNYLLEQFPTVLAGKRVLVLSGLTGSGKTELLRSLADSPNVPDLLTLDLEELAHHRGSAFGGSGPQPSQATFENELFVRLLLAPQGSVLLEDESSRIGCRQLPPLLYQAITRAPLLLLEAPLAERVARIHREYILAPSRELGVRAVRERLEAALTRLTPRLGSDRVRSCREVLHDAETQGAWHEAAALAPFILILLEQYYDPLYRKALAKHQRPVLLAGDKEAITAWLTRRPHPSA